MNTETRYGDPRSEDLTKRATVVMFDYLRQSTRELAQLVRKGYGRQVVGDVINRPEDEEIGIDQIGERILEILLEKHGLPAQVFSEHRNFGSEQPQLFGALDPFDNSGEYKRGLDTPVYTVLSFYDDSGNPIVSGTSDIRRRRLFYHAGGQSKIRYLDSPQQPVSIFPSQTTSIKDARFVLASYVGSNRYHEKFTRSFRRMLRQMPPKAFWHGKGGAHIYAYLAAGVVDAYVMFDEPRSEIDPGFAIAKTAGCEIVSVRPNGDYENYKFIPGYQHKTVDLLVATSTPTLRDEIINYYMGSGPIIPRIIYLMRPIPRPRASGIIFEAS